ncbi:MAG: ATP-binding cassette domain-containing protein [Pseudomonadota bacterium]
MNTDTAATARGPAIAYQGLAKYYGETTAVAPLDIDIAPGTLVALVGASGSGKSTLLKMTNRLIEPSQGGVQIGGEDITAQDAHTLRRAIGYVFQNIGLFPHMTIAQNIGIGPKLSGDGPLSAEAIDDLLTLVDLPTDFASRMPDQLSGGQQQRVGVARALAGKPGLMLMDEPFGALDPVTRELLAHEYRRLHDDMGLTTIMVTHDMAEALLIADRIWVMAGGRIAADATPGELLAGGCGPEAEELVAVPRGQAEKLVEARRAALANGQVAS